MSGSEAATTRRPGLTPEQQKALATDKNISVTAGAGSGKTTILVERYLNLVLEKHIDVRRVLAITFTDKAAAEMKDRVAREIRERLENNPAAEEREQLMALRERLSSAQISTIHAFCGRLLRDFAVASGVDPDFSVPNELQQKLLIQDAINEIFDALDKGTLQGDYTRETWHELLRQISPADVRKMLAALLASPYQAQKLQQKLINTTDDALFCAIEAHFYELLERFTGGEKTAAALLPLFRNCLSAGVDREALKDQGREAFALMDEILINFESSASQSLLWQQLLTLSEKLTTKDGNAFKTLTSIGNKAHISGAYDTLLEISTIIEPLRQFAGIFGTAVPGALDKAGLHNQRMILYLYELVQTVYREKKDERGLLDFDDLQLLALKTLAENADVRNELRLRYRYIMVDEFQDTNDLQWELIALMGMPDGQLDPQKFFVVGDPKQSIYGFRDADVRVFKEVKKRFAENAGVAVDAYSGNVVLQDSFRFLPRINRFTNHVFRQIIGSEAANPFDVNYEPLETQRQAPDSAYIELAVLDDAQLKSDGLSQEDYLAQRICALLKLPLAAENGALLPAPPDTIYRRAAGQERSDSIRPGDIAVLIPRRTHLLVLETAFRRYGIPFKTIGGVGFYRRQEIFDVYHLLRFLDNPSDDLALVALLRSPFAGISDAALFWLAREDGKFYRQKLNNIKDISIYPETDRKALLRIRQQLQRWQKRRDRLSLSRLVSEIFDDSLYRATLAAEWNGEQMLANLDKLLEQIRDFEQTGFMALADFIDSLRETIDLDPREGEAQIAMEDESTVKIMTIHQSKGLEFPVVMLPYLQQTVRGSKDPFRFDPELGLSAKWRDPLQNYEAHTPFLFNWIEERRQQKNTAELKRLFYVAVTRARDQVYMAGSGKNDAFPGDSPLDWAVRSLKLAAETAFSDGSPHFTFTPSANLPLTVIRQIPKVLLADGERRDIAPALNAHIRQLGQYQEAATTDVHIPVHLRKIDDVPKGVTFSATQLLTFQNDPAAYFLRYHRGFFESDYEFLTRYAEPDALSLLKGKVVHKILEDGLPADEGEILARLDDVFFQFEIFDEEERDGFRREIPGLLLPFIGSETAAEVFGAGIFHNELSLTMQLGDDFFTGTLDRIYQNGQGIWEVIDYKTNTISATQVEKTGEKYAMQMEGYALLLSRAFPGQPHYRVRLYFLKPQKTFQRDYTPADVQKIGEKFLDIISQIKQYHPFGNIVPD